MEMKKIAGLIKERNLTGKDCEFHTQRGVTNRKGEMTGKVRVLVLKNESKARVEYVCPECGFYGYLEAEWKRPFSFNCEKCGATIRVPKLREQVKKEMKSEKAD